MTRNFKASFVLYSAFLILLPWHLLVAQQSHFQISFLAPAAIRLTNPATAAGVSPVIVRSEHLPYLTEVAKESSLVTGAFQPTASDLLIQQAEERFQSGRKSYLSGNAGDARTSFDAAITLMLRASDNPTDRRLFEERLEEMVDSIHRDDLSGLGAAATDDVPGFDKAPLDDIVTTTFPVDPSIKDKVQSEVKLTTSALPLVVNDTVLSYINYFNGPKGHKTIEAGMERAGRYQAMVSRVLAEEGLPQELIHLAQAESGFLPRAVSRAAATGMWQFVKFRGNQYGLMQTPLSDDRMDPEKATRAAAHHLHDLYNEFGDWYLAIAAYNCGPGAVERAVERTGYADFWELRDRGVLPRETTNYVPIILAMTIMAKNAPEYGLDQIVPDPPIEYDTITIRSPTSLALISDLTGTSTTELLQLNPALLRSMAPADYEVRVPKGSGPQLTAALDLIPAERRASWRSHRVEEGESLASIAKLFNVSAGQITSANGLTDDPAPGDRLLIPVVYHEPAAPAHAVRRSTAARRTVRSTVTARKATPAKRTTTASVHRPLHPGGATLAQVKTQNHPLSR